jgi:hypothetical protein
MGVLQATEPLAHDALFAALEAAAPPGDGVCRVWLKDMKTVRRAGSRRKRSRRSLRRRRARSRPPRRSTTSSAVRPPPCRARPHLIHPRPAFESIVPFKEDEAEPDYNARLRPDSGCSR